MSFTNSTPFAGPFGCAFPGFTPNFNPTFAQSWNPNFSHTDSQHFTPGTPSAWTPLNGYAPSPPFGNFSNSPSPLGWNSTPWFSNPAWNNSVGHTSPAFSANSFTSNDPAWFNNFNTNNPAWFGHFAHPTHESFNTPFAAQPSWTPYGWNQNSSFSPWNSNVAPATNTTPWFANPNFFQPTNAAQFQGFTPWLSPAFGGSSWFAPHNWTNTNVNPASMQSGTPTPNGNHANPTPYAVSTPPNATAARDAA